MFSISSRQILTALKAIVVVFAFHSSGCTKPSARGLSSSERSVPIQWTDCVDRLVVLAYSEAGSHSESEAEEWIELFGRLPELVADSDTDQQTFDRVDGWVSRLVPVHAEIFRKHGGIQEVVAAESTKEVLLELKKMAEAEKVRRQMILEDSTSP